MNAERPLVSICIVTRDRPEELVVALESCFAQAYPRLEVLVFCDEADEESEKAVREQFPEVRFFRADSRDGIPQLRNRGFHEAKGKYVVSLDDDAYYTSPDSIGQMVADFEANPGAAAIAMPFAEPRHEASGPMRMPDERHKHFKMRNFTGCAHALRRDIALEVGAYRDFIARYREDRDLSIRLLENGLSIVYGTSAPVMHLYSQRRDRATSFGLDVRSTLLFDYINVPHPHVLVAMTGHALKLFVYKFRLPELLRRMGYVCRALQACWKYRDLRYPVSRNTYRLYRSLPGHGPMPWPGDVPGPASRQGAGRPEKQG